MTRLVKFVFFSYLLWIQKIYVLIIFQKRKWQNTTSGRNRYTCVDWPPSRRFAQLFQMIFFLSKVSLTNWWPVYTRLSSKNASLKTTRKTSKMTIPRLDKGFFIEFHWVSFIGFWNDLAKKETCLHLHEIMNMRK